MAITRVLAGPLLADDFNRPNSDVVGGDWAETICDWDIVSNTVRTGPNTSGCVLKNNVATLDGGFVQADASGSLNTGHNPGLMLRVHGSFDGYEFRLFNNGSLLDIRKWESGIATVIGGTVAAYVISGGGAMQFYCADGIQWGRFYTGSEWITISRSDTTFNSTNGVMALRSASGTGASVTKIRDNVLLAPNPFVEVTLTGSADAGWKAKLLNSSGTVMATATESGGVATVDSRDASAKWPLAGWRLIVTDASNNLLDEADENVFPGEEYEWDGGALPLGSNLTITATDTRATLSIDQFYPHPSDPTDTHQDTRYQISTSDTFGSFVVNELGGAGRLLSFMTDAVLTPATTYYGRVATVGEGGQGAFSEVVEFQTGPAAPTPNTPTVSVEEAALDFVRLAMTEMTHPEGEITTAELYDSVTNNKPYPIARWWQVTTFADTGYASTLHDTGLVAILDLERIFDELAPGTQHRARGLVQDGKYGTLSAFHEVTFTTAATPANRPGAPAVTVESCLSGAVSLSSAPYSPFAAGAQTRKQWRARGHATNTQNADIYTTSDPDEFETFSGWAQLPPGTWYFDSRDEEAGVGWSLWGATDSCTIYERPPVPEFVDQVSGVVVAAPIDVTIGMPPVPDVAWRFVWEAQQEDQAWEEVQNSTALVHTFGISGRNDAPHWLRAKACYPVGHPAEGQCGDWAELEIRIDRTGLASRHLDFRTFTAEQLQERLLPLWDWTNVTATLVDRNLGTTLAPVGVLIRNHKALQTRQAVAAFPEFGRPVTGRFSSMFAILPTEQAWWGHKYAHVPYLRGGLSLRALGTVSGEMSGLQHVVKAGIQPWPFFPQSCVCDCGPGQDPFCICCNLSPGSCEPCTSCHAMPTACSCGQAARDLARRGRLQPNTVWRYGVAERVASVERHGRRQGLTTPQLFGSANLAGADGMTRGLEVPQRFELDDPELGVGCFYRFVWYTLVVDVQREGSSFRVRTRVRGPGLDPDSGWAQNQLLALGEPDGTMPCGYCGLALWHLASNLTADHGVLFRSFSGSGLSYETCEPAPAPCVGGYTAVRVLSKGITPASHELEWFAIGAVPCPE
jgi:hypothetical protein